MSRYPIGSCNPSSKIQGGCGLYTQPLILKDKRTTFLEYSVLFEKEFDWVKGGKLPGLFGGKPGSSGGSKATEGFSCRLMVNLI